MDVFVDDVRPYLFGWLRQGEDVVLLTLVNVEGSSPRRVGSQMLINGRGESVGLLSSGCIESALLLEALEVIKTNQWKLIRYGLDSDFFDIKLLCGSGIDILLTPIKAESWVDKLEFYFEQRTPVDLIFDISHQTVGLQAVDHACSCLQQIKVNQLTRVQVSEQLSSFTKRWLPKHRLVVIGQGAVFEYFMILSKTLDLEVIAYSPSFSDSVNQGAMDVTYSYRNPKNNRTRYLPLKSKNSFDVNWLDQYCSVVILNHDHEWDIPILRKALDTEVSHIAVMGSKLTHRHRLARLMEDGVSSERLGCIKSPAGIDLGGNSPPEIALSILAEVVAVKSKCF